MPVQRSDQPNTSTANMREVIANRQKRVASQKTFFGKVAFLAGSLLTTLRANPGASSVALGAAALGGYAALRGNQTAVERTNEPLLNTSNRPHKITPVHGYQNPNPQGVEVMIVDTPVGDPVDPDHSAQVVYVVNSHLDPQLDVEALLSVEGMPLVDFNQICSGIDKLEQIADMQNPPEVVVSSLGVNAANFMTQSMMMAEKDLEWIESTPASRMPPGARDQFLRYTAKEVYSAKSMVDNYSKKKCIDSKTIRQKFDRAYQKLVDAGITVVTISGNEGRVLDVPIKLGMKVGQEYFTSMFFGEGENLPQGVIVVGGVDDSNPKHPEAWVTTTPSAAIDLAASSVNVPIARSGLTSNGTSFAAPQVAAVVANIKAINPKLKPAQIEKILKDTATPVEGDTLRVGAGLINPEKAYKLARSY